MIAVFTISYAIRSVFLFFMYDLLEIDSFFKRRFIQLIGVVFWEIPPLFSVLILHYFKVKKTR